MEIIETPAQRLERFQHDMGAGMQEATIHRCFNQGSDARIAGIPITDCPYRFSTSREAGMWREGWRHVHDYWGIDRPSAPPLRKVKKP